MKDDHTQEASEVNPVSTWWLIWLFHLIIVVEKEEKRHSMTGAESHEPIQYISLPEARV